MVEIKTLLHMAKDVRLNAYAPYSNFLVGCCLETTKGTLFTGCNVENASYGLTLCAEANAIAAMIAKGEHKIKQLFIIGGGALLCMPCGACRQRIYEFATSDTLIHFSNLSEKYKTVTLEALLPFAFNLII